MEKLSQRRDKSNDGRSLVGGWGWRMEEPSQKRDKSNDGASLVRGWGW